MPDLEYVPKTTAQTWLLAMCEQLVEKFVFHVTDVQAIVEQTQNLQLCSGGLLLAERSAALRNLCTIQGE